MISGSVTKRETGSIVILPSAESVPARNSIEEMCPSPVARRLMMKRCSPSSKSLWSGWGTIEGLKRAADSSAYSPEKSAPMSKRRSRVRGRWVKR